MQNFSNFGNRIRFETFCTQVQLKYAKQFYISSSYRRIILYLHRKTNATLARKKKIKTAKHFPFKTVLVYASRRMYLFIYFIYRR